MTHDGQELQQLRKELDSVNHELLEMLNRRAALVSRVSELKHRRGMPTYDPSREQAMLDGLVRDNKGPFADDVIARLFAEIFRASLGLMEQLHAETLKVSRQRREADLVIDVDGATVGDGEVTLFAGPCAVENAEQIDAMAQLVASHGLRFLRGGAYKPRSSPYAFQGLGKPGLEMLRAAADRHGLRVVSEVMDTRTVELACEYVDVLQIGARNMYNYDLLREVGKSGKPVLLKRHFSATLEELLYCAEYIVNAGNEQLILCERGIRTFERATRNTLDVSAVPLLRRKTYLPVIVDVTHAAGRRDILAPLARAALAAGANGLMVEVHPAPALARSDCQQQLDPAQFERFLRDVGLPARSPVRAAEAIP